ncbi:unnamed protein product, partial [Mesorhabditis spiculigera]
MSLEALLCPAVTKLEDAFEKQDEDRYISCYAPTACYVEVKEKAVYDGPDEIRALFRSRATLGNWTTEIKNRRFSGGDALICYTCTYTIFLASGGSFTADILQYWRRMDGEYLLEVEHSITA